MLSMSSNGSFKRTQSYLRNLSRLNIRSILESQGRAGVAALERASPIESGLAANSWNYVVTSAGGNYTITWTNSDVENGFPVAIMLQYGYATGTGGYIQGRDYINPAIKPIFDLIEKNVRKAVTSA